MKKTISIIFAVLLAFGSCICAFAEEVPATRTITFGYGIGNETTKTEHLTPGDEIPFPTENDTKIDGYKFAGWFYDDDTEFEDKLMPDRNVTVGARYYKIHTLKFVTGVDDIKYDDQSHIIGEKINYPDTSAVKGYKFGGWYNDENRTTKFTNETMPGSDVTLYGKFTKLYSLTIVSDPANVKTFDTLYYAAGDTVKLPDLTKEGYTVKSTKWTGGEAFAEGTAMPAKDSSITVTYEKTDVTPKMYKLSIFAVKDGVADENATVKEFAADSALPEVSLDGYTFEGFYTDKELKNKIDFTKMPAKDTTVYAKFVTAKSYTVTYKVVKDGTPDASADTSAKLVAGSKLVAPSIGGYTFEAFYAKFEDNKLVDVVKDPTMPSNDYTIYVSYKKADTSGKYKLSFVSNEEAKKFVDQSLDAGTEIKLPDTALANYYFCGWFSDKEMTKEFKETKMPAADTTVYAKYAINLSALKTVLNSLSESINKSLKGFNITSDQLNTLIKAAGYKFSYKINGKEYEVNDINKVADEVLATFDKETKFGSVSDFSIAYTQNGKAVENATINKFVYNDIKTEEPTTKKDEPTTKKDEPTTKKDEPTTQADPTTTTKQDDNGKSLPNTGSAVAGAAVAVAAIVAATAAIFIVLKKKKDDSTDEAAN